MTAPKTIARRMAYAGGALGALHWLRHRDTLTVVMFHRVTAVGSLAEKNADFLRQAGVAHRQRRGAVGCRLDVSVDEVFAVQLDREV